MNQITPLEVAQRIVKVRRSLGLKQAEFAKKLGICSKTLSRYESAKRVPDVILWNQIESLAKPQDMTSQTIQQLLDALKDELAKFIPDAQIVHEPKMEMWIIMAAAGYRKGVDSQLAIQFYYHKDRAGRGCVYPIGRGFNPITGQGADPAFVSLTNAITPICEEFGVDCYIDSTCLVDSSKELSWN